MKHSSRYIFLAASLMLSTLSHAEKYLLCGPNEDGCYRNIYQYCNCIPYNEQQGSQPYCLDFDNMRCHPLTQVPDCDAALIRKDQASCLATIFQSEREPGCRATTQAFCVKHNMYFCDEDGHPGSCHKS